MAAMSSMRLFVVTASLPLKSFSTSLNRRTAPQPPGPGLPEQAPSVKISTLCSFIGSIEPVGAGAAHVLVKVQLVHVFKRVLGLDKGAGRVVQQVVETGQEEPERTAAREQGQRLQFVGREGPHLPVGLQHEPRLGDVEGLVRLEAPGIQTDRQIVGEEIVAREIEVDQSRQLAAQEEDVVGEQIGVDHALGQLIGPGALQVIQLRLQLLG